MKTFKLILFIVFFSTIPGVNRAETGNNTVDNQDPKVTTVRITKIKETQAECSCKVEGTASEKGVCYSDTPSPTVNNKKVVAPASAGSIVTISITGLKEGTKYYVRAYAKNSTGTFYGNELNFTTLSKAQESKQTTGKKVEQKAEPTKK